jgi:transposase InsO family protein
VRLAFIHAEKAQFPVAALCRILGVSRQGYYASVKRRPSARARADAELQEQVREAHVASAHRYGSPRVQRELQRKGLRVGKRRVERAMRSMGLVARAPKRFRRTTTRDPSHPVAPNTLARTFTASRPNERWVTDITYVWTDEGWGYLAAILDLYSRAVVGWALDASMTTALPLTALDAAVRRRRPGPGLLHHSDRGCQYTSADYRAALAKLGVEVSMSRKGNCWDNAVAESFFATLKTELIHRKRWATLLELRAAVFEYVEVFYNRRRLHSSLDYKTPAEIESAYALAVAA